MTKTTTLKSGMKKSTIIINGEKMSATHEPQYVPVFRFSAFPAGCKILTSTEHGVYFNFRDDAGHLQSGVVEFTL